MPVIVCGSIATDHLMHFPGAFADQLLADHLDKISLSFLVDDLVVRRGGVAANIAFGMAQLGQSPVLIGAVGADFEEYRAWLTRNGVDCESVYVSALHHTARFVCTTDEQMCQIASFYAGAMSEARNIELAPAVERTGAELVIVSADDPAAMVRHSEECRDRGYAFAADPSQQIARMDGPDLISLVEGADLLFTNDYERQLLESKTGLSDADILGLVDVRVCTLGSKGVEISGRNMETITVAAAQEYSKADPTGVGDGFRAGFLAARGWGLSWERSAQVGGLLATLVLETVGTQEYQVKQTDFVSRLAESYGDAAAAEIAPHLAELD
jgi:adenosine kinase